MNRTRRKYTLLAQVLALLVVTAMALPAGAAVAAPPTQAMSMAASLGLGEYVFVDALTDATSVYEVTIPEAGYYVITPGG